MKVFFTKLRLFGIIVLIVISLVSFFYVSERASEPSTYGALTRTLDEKRNAVLTLTIGSTVAANLITALPDDTGNPLANNLSNASIVLMAVQVAIFIEKYLMPVAGFVVFKFIVPVLCIMAFFGMLVMNDDARRALKRIACGIVIISIAVYALAPVSVILSQIIERTCSESISEALSFSENISALMDSEDDLDGDTDDDKNVFEKAVDAASSVFNGISNSVSFIVNTVSDFLGCLLDALVVFIVTTIVVPLVTIFGIVKICKLCIMNIMKLV